MNNVFRCHLILGVIRLGGGYIQLSALIHIRLRLSRARNIVFSLVLPARASRCIGFVGGDGFAGLA